MNTDKLAINRKNFVRLQLKFAFIIRPPVYYASQPNARNKWVVSRKNEK